MKDFFSVKKNDANILKIEISIVKILNHLSEIYEGTIDTSVTLSYRKATLNECQLHAYCFDPSENTGQSIYIHKDDSIDIVLKKVEIIEMFMRNDITIQDLQNHVKINKSDFY